MKGQVSIAVVNRNKKEFLKNCLNSIFNQSYKNIEVIVIDNASSDSSVEMVKENFSQAKVITNSQNLMVAKSYNQGIRASQGEYVLCVNNDVILEEKYLERAVSKFGLNERIGVVAGKLLNPLTKKIDSTGQFLTLSRRAYERGYKIQDREQFKEGYIWGVTGACALYRKKMLEEIKIGGEYFDETYQAYLEDLDLNWRMSKLGWKAYFTSEAVAYHYRGVTGWQNKKKFGYLNLCSDFKLQFIKNRYSTMIKNEYVIDFLKFFPFIALYDLYLWICLLSEKPTSIIRFVISRQWIKEAFRKRKLIYEKI